MNILIFLGISLLIQLILFIPAFRFKTDKLTDLSYALSFIILTIIAYLYGRQNITSYILTIMILIWAFRLGTFLLIRISLTKKDHRFDGIRENPKSFASFWIMQGIVVFVLLIPTFFYFPQPLYTLNIFSLVGFTIYAIGVLFEATADHQKFSFKSKKKNKKKFISSGLWSLSRHPNYFGEILVWIGIYIFTIPALSTTQSAIAAISPLAIIILLVFFTGIPPLEKKYNEKYKNNKAYQEYKSKTPLLVPFTK